MKKLILLTLLIYIAIPSQSFGQEQIKKDRAEAIYLGHKALVETQNFKFVADWVFNNDTRKEVPGDLNTIRINTSEVKGLLATVDSDRKAIAFKGNITNYSAQFNDDNQEIFIGFQVDNYSVSIEVKSNRTVFLSLNTTNGETIKYKGSIN
ncbi:MAG: DUF4251 domain-containing protein [Bacteroidota bacterium]